MKRLLLVGCLSCLLLLTLSACSRSTEASENDNIVYGQVVKTDENQITIESGDYTYGGSFEGDGCEKSYNLPENVFYDDFKAGDIVSILCDGRDATAVANVKDVNHRRSSGLGSDPGSENSGSDAASGFGQTVLTGADAAQLSADDEPVAVNDDNYEEMQRAFYNFIDKFKVKLVSYQDFYGNAIGNCKYDLDYIMRDLLNED